MRPLALIALAGVLECCKPTPAPPPDGPVFSDATTPAALPAVIIYGELLEGGCVGPDDGGDGLASLVSLEFSDQEPSWLSCLSEGRPIASCAVPCGIYMP